MTNTTSIANSTDFNNKIIDFIGTFMSHLNMDKMIFEEGVASSEKKELYNNFLPGNEFQLIQSMRANSSMFLIGKSMEEYFIQLKNRSAKPLSLGLSASDAKILVWAKIEDEDELTENALLMSEAAVNSAFSKHGIYFLTTVVEKGDHVEIPPHYKSLNLTKAIEV